MFILNQAAHADNTLENIEAFVNCWSSFYNWSSSNNETLGDSGGNPIVYLEELHLNANLTEENIRRLLRWKSPRHLTHENKLGKQNLKVQKTLRGIDTINSFRRLEVADEHFFDFTAKIFSNGFVYRAFLFHIARPSDYPIWDQHVARVHARLTHREETVNWQHYTDYRAWFAKLKRSLNIGDELTKDNMGRTKRLDDALMGYGQYLASYGR